jgi:hypothetical protein
MSVREKIVVALMLVTVSYGLYSWLSPGAPAPSTPEGATGSAQKIEALVATLAQSFDQTSTLEHDHHLLKRAEEPWTARLFLEKPVGTGELERTGGAAAASSPVNAGLVYSGYIAMGHRQVAVINGIEYEAGEQLDQSTLVLRRIQPDRVILGTPEKDVLDIPLWTANELP